MSNRQSLILCILYFFGYLILFPVVELALLDMLSMNLVYRFLNAFEWGFYLIFPAMMLKIVWPWIRREFFLFLRKPLKNLMIILKNYGLMMLTSILVNLFLLIIFQLENSGNQSQLIELYASQPWKVLFASLVFAPIVEELVFRGALFAPFRKKNKAVAYLISSLSFGFLHVYQSLFTGNFKDLLFLMSYALLGSFMCRVYDETDSMFSSMVLHFINNFISIVLTFMI